MKTALVTGGSRGIGAAAARRLAREGYKVAINYQNAEQQALALAEELSGFALRADISDPEQGARLVETAVSALGGLDLLVCNAGVSYIGLLTDMTEEQWRRLFAVNVDGMYHVCRAAIPHFVHRKAGKIVTVASMWGQVGASCEVAYSASKGAVIAFTQALAKELAPSGVTVNCVAPGVIATDMNAHLDAEAMAVLCESTPLGRIGTPEDVAAAIAFFASDDAAFLTGQLLGVNGGLVI